MRIKSWQFTAPDGNSACNRCGLLRIATAEQAHDHLWTQPMGFWIYRDGVYMYFHVFSIVFHYPRVCNVGQFGVLACVCRMVLKCPSNYKQLKTGHVPLVVGRSGSCLRVPPECYHVVFMFWPIEHHHPTPNNHLTVMFKVSKMGLRPSPVLYEFGEVLQLSQLHWGQAPDSSTYRAAGTCAPFMDLPGRPKWHISCHSAEPRVSRVTSCYELGMWKV